MNLEKGPAMRVVAKLVPAHDGQSRLGVANLDAVRRLVSVNVGTTVVCVNCLVVVLKSHGSQSPLG